MLTITAGRAVPRRAGGLGFVFEGAGAAPEISCAEADARRTKRRSEDEGRAFASLAGSHDRALLSFLCGLVGDYHTAQDLKQDTFLRALSSYRRGADPLRERAWLFRIGLRVAADWW